MISKYIVPALAVSNLMGAEAVSRHRHLHKKDLVYAATEIEVTTEYITVTVTEGDETETSVIPTTVTESTVVPTTSSVASTTSSAAPSTTSTVAPSSTSVVVVSSTSATPTPSSTTLATVVSSTSVAPVEPVVTSATSSSVASSTSADLLQNVAAALSSVLSPSSTTSSAAAAATSASSSSSSSGIKRGLAYNTASLVSSIVSSGGSYGWCYDWGFDDAGLTADVEYIPMLWGPTKYTSSWDTAAAAAVTKGTEALFSFNECDNSGQCNMAAAEAATYHQQYLNPYEGQIKIGAPAISSSETTGQGLDWLASFITACNGNCAMDFINLHWYGPGGQSGGETFLAFLAKAYAQTSLPIWVTEFQATSGDESAFLEYVMDQLDNNSTLSYVHKYSYFYLDTLYSGTSLTSIGSLYASTTY